jgi:hypothetical protein
VRRLAALCTAATVLGPACAGAPGSRYYVASSTLSRATAAEAADDVREVADTASSLLRQGEATVGFYPPDQCKTTSATQPGTTTVEGFITTDCGVLMSSLEKAAALEGYSVVDWKTLRDAHKSPRDAAIEVGADVLFVIDELSVNERRPDQFKVTDIGFYEQKSLAERAPITVKDVQATGMLCKQIIDQQAAAAGPTNVDSATLAIKMVGVQTGRAQWFYRRTVGDAQAADAEVVDLYYEAPGTRRNGKAALVGGIVLATLGVGLIAAGAVVNERADSRSSRNAGAGIALLSIPFLAGGTAVTIVGAVHEGRPATYPDPDTVVCRMNLLPVNPFSQPAPTPTPVAPTAGSSFTVTEQTSGDRDQTRARREELVRNVVSNFIEELRVLQARAPAPAEPAPASAPP